MNPYVFFVGCARSGTTLVERLAHAHSMLAVTHDTRWIVDLYRDGAGLTGDGRVTPRLIEQLLEHPRFKTLHMDEHDLRRVDDTRPAASYAEFVTALFDRFADRHGKQHAGDRTPEYVKSVPLLHGLWPAARFVHIIRDGRNVCLSVAMWQKGARHFSTWDDDPVSTTAVWWDRNVRLAREAGVSLEADLYHELRYESLVADSAAECARLCAFLGLPFDERMLRFHEGRTLDEPGLSAKKAWRPVTTGLRDWRAQMPPDDVVRFEAAAGDLLEELGYPRAIASPPPAALEHAARIRGAYVGRALATGLPIPGSWAAIA